MWEMVLVFVFVPVVLLYDREEEDCGSQDDLCCSVSEMVRN